MKKIHISQARQILNSRRQCDILVYKADGTLMRLPDAVGLRYDFRTGTRNVKLIASGQMRRIRDSLIMAVDGMQVYL